MSQGNWLNQFLFVVISLLALYPWIGDKLFSIIMMAYTSVQGTFDGFLASFLQQGIQELLQEK